MKTSRRNGFWGWARSLWEGPRFVVKVDIGTAYATSVVGNLEDARHVAGSLMEQIPGANAEALVLNRRGEVVERVRRGA